MRRAIPGTEKGRTDAQGDQGGDRGLPDRGVPGGVGRDPGQGRHWLAVKLVGTRTNRAAIGARIRVDYTTRAGARRSVYRQVGATSSYGGSSPVEHVGLGDAEVVEGITVTWPASRTTQTFRGVPADRTIEIAEGAASFRVVEHSAARAVKTRD